MLFGVCCYQFYHYQRIKTATNFRSQLPTKKPVLEPFSYELYDSIKDSENVIMLLDMGYTEDFENRLHGVLSDLAQTTASNPRKLRILRLRFESLAEKEEFEKRCNIKLPYQTIFLIKNQYVPGLQDFSFNDVMDNPRTLNIYFSEVPILTDKERHKLCQNISQLTHNEFLMLFYCDKNDPHYSDYERVFKNIELAVSENPLNSKAILMMINNQEHLKDFTLEGATSGSLHLMQKYSDKYSLQPANAEVCGLPFNQMRDIKLLGKDGQMLIALHLDKLNTFSNVVREYEMKLVVDRNRITKEAYRDIVKVLQKLKAENTFPEVCFSLKFEPIKERDGPFMIKAIDHKKYQRSMEVLDGKSKDPLERAELGKHTYEYLFDKDSVTEEAVREFLSKVTKGQWPEYFRTAKVSPLVKLDRLNAKNFSEKVLKDSHDHLVLQYSSHCSGCKAAAPYLLEFQATYPNKNLKIHKLNSIKNDLAGQVQYPFTPVLLLYKNGWKPRPVQYDLENLMTNPQSLSDFCQVTSQVQPLSQALLAEHFSQASKIDWSSLLTALHD